MCLQQSTSNGQRNRRNLLMAAVVVAVVVIVSVIIIVASAGEEDDCMGDLQCLPISKCQGHINPDFIYGCGSHDSPRICCLAKSVQTENATNFLVTDSGGAWETASRIAKMQLLPERCGIGDTEDKIANGMNASIGQFPWMAILGYRSKTDPFIRKLCGGTIINDRYILTAAHCLFIDGLELDRVTLGELNLATRRDCMDDNNDCSDDPIDIPIKEVIKHNKFNRTSLKNDIALLRLAHNITKYTDFIKPICLPFGLRIDEEYFLNRNFTIAGWGLTSPSSVGVSSILQYTSVVPWEANKCNEALRKPFGPIENRQVCATGPEFKEACRGDSGGPMTYVHLNRNVLRATQIGVVSFKSIDTCGTVDVPTVFTRVDRYLDWILDNIES